MTKTLAEGGFAFDEKYASVIYATYVSSVWYLPLVGGWLADKVLGARRAVLIGGGIIVFGPFSMGLCSLSTFFSSFVLFSFGTGLLKANITFMVGEVCSPADPR